VTTTHDVIVIGSGAAGMSTALKAAREGLDVLVLEASEYLGGTSAISGGWAWVPGNKQGVATGDTREDIEDYIKHIAEQSYDPARVKTFLDAVPESMEFFESVAGLDVVYDAKSPDYQMDAPGAKPAGRAVTFRKTDARVLKEDRLRLRPYYYPLTVFGYMPEIGPDLSTFIKANRSVKAFAYVSRRLVTSWLQTIVARRGYVRTNGNALMTQMIATARALGIPLWTEAPVTRLIQDADGAVTGVAVGGRHQAVLTARLAVVIAAGGFGGNSRLRQRTFPHDPNGNNHRTPTQGHTGDSITLAEAAGGVLDDSTHNPAAWAPVTAWRSLRGQDRLFPHLRAFGLPGLIAVNRQGKRFGNESLSYHDFGRAMIADSKGETDTHAWIVADRTAMARYGIGYAKPSPVPTWYYTKVGYLTEAATLEALAAKVGVPAENLLATVEEFNAGARDGVDPLFGRGSNWYHHFKGDPDHKPNPNLAPLTRGPFYAVKIQMADLGTFSGLSVNDSSQVLTEQGSVVPGLYAVGTAAVSPFGGGYPGYGACIGPAMVFGYAAGRDIASIAHTSTSTTRSA
jgi:succinate dehydrogenase/fumarate reductase flavoprotein subunit